MSPYSPSLYQEIIDSITSIEGNPKTLILPHDAGDKMLPIIAGGIKQLENSDSNLFIFILPMRDNNSQKILPNGIKFLVSKTFNIHQLNFDLDLKNTTLLNKIVAEESSENQEEFLYDLIISLPLLEKVRPNAKLIVVMIGYAEIKKALILGKSLSTELKKANPIIIAVSNFSNKGFDQAEFCDYSRFYNYSSKELSKNHHIGTNFAGIISGLVFANTKGSNCFTTISKFVQSQNEIDYGVCSASAIIWDYHPPHFSRDQKLQLTRAGFLAIQEYLTSGKIPNYKTVDAALQRKSGVFITLRQNSILRGCIGQITANEPLFKRVQRLSIAAATSDPRFSPLKLEDLPNITLKIAILSPIKRIEIDQIRVGKHGLLIEHDERRGVLLPEVPVDRGWNVQTYLKHLCMKAGLDQGVLKENPKLYGFTSMTFENSYCAQDHQ